MSPARFKEIREHFGLTQAELADLLGVSGYKPISHYETGFRRPSPLIAAVMSLLDSLPERKARELIEQLQGHMKKVRKDKKRKTNARE
jgi:DNA-binding transcriptional regulator YiaG